MRDVLAPLAPAEPTDAEIAGLLARADRRTRRRRIRLAGAGALATVALTATLASLPSEQAPMTASAILRTTAAIAADQPPPPAWAGFRYLQEVERRTLDGYTAERIEESWVDSDWQGRRLSPAARVVAGRLPTGGKRPKLELGKQLTPDELRQLRAAAAPAIAREMLKARDIRTPHDIPNLYGDGALSRVPLDELPADAEALRTLLLEAHKDGRWRLAGSWDAPQFRYDVLRDILTLLTLANVTSEQRAALITVLTTYGDVTPLPSVKDHRGREGRGVDIPVGPTVRVIFAPDTSELLEWSEPGAVHTFVRTGHVAKIGDRP